MSDFNQPNIERKKCVWTTKYKRLLEMCIVQHVEMKSLFIFHTKKRLAFMTVRSAKPAATFWIFLSRTKNRQLCCLAGMVHIVLQEKRVATTKSNCHLHFWRNFSANQIQAHPKLNRKIPQKLFHLWHDRVDTPLVNTVKENFLHILISYTLSLFQSNMIFSVSNDGI